MDIPTSGSPIACKLYPVPLKCQMVVDKEIRLLENTGCISKSLKPWTPPVIIVPKKPPLKLSKQELCLVLDYWSPNQLINTAHDGRSVISFYPFT